jgi:hypothetical protein
VAQDDCLHFSGRRAFEVQGHRQRGHQRLDIGVADMAAVFAQMRGDAVRPRRFRQKCGTQRVRPGTATGIPYCGHVVDVDPKPKLARLLQWMGHVRLPAFPDSLG